MPPSSVQLSTALWGTCLLKEGLFRITVRHASIVFGVPFLKVFRLDFG